MEKITIISDSHIGDSNSNLLDLVYLLSTVEGTVVLAGDIYDQVLCTKKDTYDIFETIAKNKKIDKWYYISGNNDFNIKELFPFVVSQEEVRFCDIVVIHGHQFDSWSKEKPSWLLRLAKKISQFTGINVRRTFLKIFPSIEKKHIMQVCNDTLAYYEGKILIMGHTHLAMCDYPYYNCGSFTNNKSSYLQITIDDNGVAFFELKNIRK